MSDLKISEKMRVAIALGNSVTLNREIAVAAMKAIERAEQEHDRIVANLLERQQREHRRDALMFAMVRDIGIFCTCLATMGLLI